MEEIFVDIKGYEGLYQISNLGRIKSLLFGKEKILKGSKDKDGYLKIILCKEEKHKTYKVHRLVATAFIPNPNGYRCVNHKDEDKANNCVENLEWCSNKYNSNYGTCQQRRVKNTDYKKVGRKNAEKLLNRKDQSKIVLQYTKDNEFVKEWETLRECGRNGFKISNISSCCRGKRKTHKGFIWKYKNG